MQTSHFYDVADASEQDTGSTPGPQLPHVGLRSNFYNVCNVYTAHSAVDDTVFKRSESHLKAQSVILEKDDCRVSFRLSVVISKTNNQSLRSVVF